MVTTLLALEVERTRAPERAGEAAVGQLRERGARPRDRRPARPDRARQGARRRPRGRRQRAGVRAAPARARRGRLAGAGAHDGRRARRAGSRPGRSRRCAASHIAVLVPGRRRGAPRAAPPRRCCARSTTRCRASRSWSAAAASRSTRWTCTAPPAEALLAANVAVARRRPSERLLSFDDTGAYRLLLPAMSDDPAELERFYADTIAPLVAYDEQYGTELVRTLETFLDNDGSMAATYKQLFTHRHTIRYRLERVQGADRPRRQLDRRPRAARPRPEGDARARRARPERPGVRARRRERPRAEAAAPLTPSTAAAA